MDRWMRTVIKESVDSYDIERLSDAVNVLLTEKNNCSGLEAMNITFQVDRITEFLDTVKIAKETLLKDLDLSK